MTTQPSIESLFDAIDAHVIGDDYGRLSVAISELARLRQIEAGARDSEALVAELKPQATAWESIRTTLDEISPGWDAGGRSPRDCAVAWVQGAAALRAERDALKCQIVAWIYDGASVGVTLIKTEKLDEERAQLTAANARAEEAESALKECQDAILIHAHNCGELHSKLDAERARAEEAERWLDESKHQREGLITAHDERVRREEREAAWERVQQSTTPWFLERWPHFKEAILSPAPDAERVDSQRPQVGLEEDGDE